MKSLPVAWLPILVNILTHLTTIVFCVQVLTGFLMNIVSILIVALCLNTYGVKIFDITSGLPQWANVTSCGG